MSILRREPVAFFGYLQVVLVAVADLMVTLNAWNPTDAQIGAAGGLYVALVALFTFLVRQSVTPMATLNREDQSPLDVVD